jgi:hypothetical protein
MVDRGSETLVRKSQPEARDRPLCRVLWTKRRRWIDLVEIFENDRGVGNEAILVADDRHLSQWRDHQEPFGLVRQIDLGVPEVDFFLQQGQPHAMRVGRQIGSEELNLRHSLTLALRAPLTAWIRLGRGSGNETEY